MLWADLAPYDRKEDTVDAEHLAHYRAIGQLRRAHPALRTGSFETLLTDDEQDVFVFLRANETERVLVALNASAGPTRFELPEGEWKALYGRHDRTRHAEVPSVSGIVLVHVR